MIRIKIVSSCILHMNILYIATCYSIIDNYIFSSSNHSNGYFVPGISEIKLEVSVLSLAGSHRSFLPFAGAHKTEFFISNNIFS